MLGECSDQRGLREADRLYLGHVSKDTFYGLLADGIVKLLRALASVEQTSVEEWAEAQGYERYLGSSIKGEAGIDRSGKRARASWRRRSCWGSCCSRTWNARGTMAMATMRLA